jgi:hypothetical protein
MLAPLIEALLAKLLRPRPAPALCPVKHDDDRNSRDQRHTKNRHDQ